jgi:hypothetical protein
MAECVRAGANRSLLTFPLSALPNGVTLGPDETLKWQEPNVTLHINPGGTVVEGTLCVTTRWGISGPCAPRCA